MKISNGQDLKKPRHGAAAGISKKRFGAVEFPLSQWYNLPAAKRQGKHSHARQAQKRGMGNACVFLF
jgi:hypothetical protein